ncbi:MAG TPA: diadenylate cyclase, partial [Candidatus Binatia bacterium]
IFARQLDLQLTTWILQGFFAIFLIIIVVIFQEELRQIFERIAIWSLGRQDSPAVRSEAVDVIVGTLADLAKDRIGAIIVIPGNQPIDRHINGGIELDGKLGENLLKSIFDPHSAGHDGAVIVEKDRVSRFAVQLPLSKDFRQLSKVGTRHSAALGLAELSDALCLVVSEEKGRISVGRDGTLRQVDNLQELGSLVQGFLRDKFPSHNPRTVSRQLLRENWVEKAVSVSLAIGLWYVFIPGSKILEVTYQVPVHIEHLPTDMVLETVEPPHVSVTFGALNRAFYLFEPKKLEAKVDASLAVLGRRTFQITAEDLNYPKNLTVKELTPDTVKISVKVSAKKTTKNGQNGT